MTVWAVGDWNLRGRDIEQQFAKTELSDRCVDAANRANKLFDSKFPGWQIYSRVIRGDKLYDRQLAAWAISVARVYTRTRKLNGHAVVAPRGRQNNWVAHAGLDALGFLLTGRYEESAASMSRRLGRIWHTNYQRIRGEVAAMMIDGFEVYAGELHHQYMRVGRDEQMINSFESIAAKSKNGLKVLDVI